MNKRDKEWYDWWELVVFFSFIGMFCKGWGPIGSIIIWIGYLIYGYSKCECDSDWEMFNFILVVGIVCIIVYVLVLFHAIK